MTSIATWMSRRRLIRIPIIIPLVSPIATLRPDRLTLPLFFAGEVVSLDLSQQMVARGCAQRYVHDGQVDIDRIDDEGVSGPDHPSRSEGDSLGERDGVGGLVEIEKVRAREKPFGGWGPKENCEGTSRVIRKGTKKPRSRWT
jgi:hypothetical protein